MAKHLIIVVSCLLILAGSVFSNSASSEQSYIEKREQDKLWRQANKAYKAGSYKEAFDIYTKLASKGSEQAQYRLAGKTAKGQHDKKLEAKAFSFEQKAAQQGSLAAQYALFDTYSNRFGKNDPKTAIKWLKKSAESGYALAQWRLGHNYKEGKYGLKKDQTKALEWLEKAGHQGLSQASVAVAEFYRFGWGVAKNEAKSKEWYKRAGEQGDEFAKHLSRSKAEREAFDAASKSDWSTSDALIIDENNIVYLTNSRIKNPISVTEWAWYTPTFSQRYKDEFERHDVIQKATPKINKGLKFAASQVKVRFNLDFPREPYDFQREGYTSTLTPETYIPFNKDDFVEKKMGDHYGVSFTNTEEFEFIKVPKDIARKYPKYGSAGDPSLLIYGEIVGAEEGDKWVRKVDPSGPATALTSAMAAIVAAEVALDQAYEGRTHKYDVEKHLKVKITKVELSTEGMCVTYKKTRDKSCLSERQRRRR